MRITDQIAYQYVGSEKPTATSLVILVFHDKQPESNPAQVLSFARRDDIAVQYLLSAVQPTTATYLIRCQLATN